MPNELLTCQCGATCPAAPGSTIGDKVKDTGYMPVLTHEGRVLHLCPTCGARARELAQELLGIMKDPYFYFGGALIPKPQPPRTMLRFAELRARVEVDEAPVEAEAEEDSKLPHKTMTRGNDNSET